MELCEQLNRQHLEHEIEEFQDWEEHKSVVCETKEHVVCPLCHEANLVQLVLGGVTCPNHRNGSCSLQLLQDTKSLENLRERLRTAFEMHSNCSHPLDVQLVRNATRENDKEQHLVANCHACDYHLVIV